jgi:hypothetical protein
MNDALFTKRQLIRLSFDYILFGIGIALLLPWRVVIDAWRGLTRKNYLELHRRH